MNGEVAPLYFVSPAQLNVQIPYEVPVGGSIQLSVNNNGQVTSQSFSVEAAAPAIFTDQSGAVVPSATAARGQTVTLFLTGAGVVTPAIATGAAPAASTAVASLPVPVANTSVTIGGVAATIQFAGIPYGLVGVVQINCQVPTR